MDIVILSLWLWQLPAMASCGIIKQGEEMQDDPCHTYTFDNTIYVDCSYRGLSELPRDLNYSAQVLHLSNNNFLTFPPELENFTQLQVLDLSNNLLTGPLPTYISNWRHLDTLNLSNNNYDSWVNIGRDVNVKNIDLSKNKINHIDEDAFFDMGELHFLDLSENRITDLRLHIFSQASKLEILILSRNYFNHVPSFQSSSLKTLHLSNCQILYIDINSLTGMQSLIEIDLSINQIEYIPDELVSLSLQELDLSYNEIYTITDKTFSSLPHLAVLDLRGNEFKEVWSTSHFSSNPFLREVRVKGNRWSCEGFSVNLLLTYEYLTKDPPKVLDSSSLICYTPSNVTQMTWQQAYIRTWHSDQESGDSYTIVAVLIGIIIGIVITSFVCRAIMYMKKPDPPSTTQETAVLNGAVTQPRVESVVMRIPLREDLPPSYDEALLMPRLNASFHSLPDFVDEPPERDFRTQRRSRSIGDLKDSRHRSDRRSTRRMVEIQID